MWRKEFPLVKIIIKKIDMALSFLLRVKGNLPLHSTLIITKSLGFQKKLTSHYSQKKSSWKEALVVCIPNTFFVLSLRELKIKN